MLTDLFAQLAEHRPRLEHSIVAVIIANEELSSVGGIGIGQLVKEGKLSHLKNGPLYWIDSADSGPTIGTGGMATWRIVVEGKIAHSGFPHQGINAAELAFAATQALQSWFYRNYPPHPKEQEYGFLASSSLKPTRVLVENDTLAKIPAKAVIEGDIRLTPWYSPQEVRDGALAFINTLDIATLPVFGPSRYHLRDSGGTVKLEAVGAPTVALPVTALRLGMRPLSRRLLPCAAKHDPFRSLALCHTSGFSRATASTCRSPGLAAWTPIMHQTSSLNFPTCRMGFGFYAISWRSLDRKQPCDLKLLALGRTVIMLV